MELPSRHSHLEVPGTHPLNLRQKGGACGGCQSLRWLFVCGVRTPTRNQRTLLRVTNKCYCTTGASSIVFYELVSLIKTDQSSVKPVNREKYFCLKENDDLTLSQSHSLKIIMNHQKTGQSPPSSCYGGTTCLHTIAWENSSGHKCPEAGTG